MDELPDEVLEYILGQLHPYKDLERCKCVSWRWYYLVKNVHVRTGLQLDKGISDYRMQWQTHVPSNSEQRIAARYSHSAVVYGDSMFIFGGGTFEATNFNDLWRFDLSTRKYVRPLSTGSYPPPKSCATFLSHGQKLILFGGWRHNSNNSWPQREGVMLYNQLHVYDVPENKWTLISGGQSDQVEENPHEPPTLARHSATICNDEMIVFGGIQRYAVAMTYSNEVWRLNLNTYKWTRQSTTSSNSTGPSPRYGQAQLQLDENNILIVGGCGGPNNIFRDAWLLTKPHENTGRNSPWIWRQVTIKASLRCGPSPTGHVWCNPVCLIRDKLVVLGPIRANDFQMVRETNSSQQHQLVAPNDNNRAPSPPVIGQLPIRRAAPQPGPGEHHQMVNDFNNRAEEERQRLETEHENILLRMRRFSRRRAPVDPAGGGAGGPGVALNMPWGRRAAVRLAAFQDDANNNNFQGPEMMSPRLQEAHQRLRTINRRINENQGNGLMGPGIAIPPLVATPPKSPLRVNRSNLMAMHVCDLSQVVGVDQPVITWLDPPSNLGCFEGAPEKLILYSLVVGKGELIMFGGLVKETSSEDDVSKVSNGLHFLSVPKRII